MAPLQFPPGHLPWDKEGVGGEDSLDNGLGGMEMGQREAELSAVEWHNPLAAAGNRCIPSSSMGFLGNAANRRMWSLRSKFPPGIRVLPARNATGSTG